MWQEIAEATIASQTADPSPVTPQVPASDQFPTNIDKSVKKKVARLKGTTVGTVKLAEGTGQGETETKAAGQVEHEKKHGLTAKKVPEAYTGDPEVKVPKPGPYVAFPKNEEPVKGVKKIAEGAALTLASLYADQK